MKRDSFIVYRSFYDAIKELDESERLKIYDSLFEYGLNHKQIKLTGMAKAVFTLIKPQLEANYMKYLNGSKPKASKKQTRSETVTNVNDNENENVNENENGVASDSLSPFSLSSDERRERINARRTA